MDPKELIELKLFATPLVDSQFPNISAEFLLFTSIPYFFISDSLSSQEFILFIEIKFFRDSETGMSKIINFIIK
jgi:hypothetical protein